MSRYVILLLLINFNVLLAQNSDRFEVKNLTINTKNNEFSPVLSNDGSILYLRSNYISEKNINEKYANFYKGELGAKGEFSKGLKFPAHAKHATFTKDGNTVYYSKKKGDNFQLYRASIDNTGRWKNEIVLPFNNAAYTFKHPALNPDNSKLFFAANLPDSYGLTDIYYVEISEHGLEYSEPKNVGENVNSRVAEVYPFVGEKDKLYFSADVTSGIRGLDIFESFFEDGQYSEAINVGAPINSNKDDFAYVLIGDSNSGYFSSNRLGSKGGIDIYYFTDRKPSLNKCTGSIKGIVKNMQTKKAVFEASVEVFSPKDHLGTILTDFEGKFSFHDLECDERVDVVSYKEGFNGFAELQTTPEKSESIILYLNPEFPEEYEEEFDFSNEITVYNTQTKEVITPEETSQINTNRDLSFSEKRELARIEKEKQKAAQIKLEEEAEREEKQRKEKARLAAIEAQRIANEKEKQERLETARRLAEEVRIQKENTAKDEEARVLAEKLAAEKATAELKRAEEITAAKEEQERIEAEELAQAKEEEKLQQEAKRIAEEIADKEKLEKEKHAAFVARQEALEKDRLERIAQAKITAEKIKTQKQEELLAEENLTPVEESEQLEPIIDKTKLQQSERERKKEERLAAIEFARLERIKAREELNSKRLEAERIAKESKEKQLQLETERIAQEAVEKEKLEAEKLKQQQLEAERIAQEALDKERQEAEKQEEIIARQKALETERLERIAQAKITAEKLKLENEKAAHAEIGRIEAERLAQEKTLAEQKLSESAVIEKAEQERLAAERLDLIEKEKQKQLEAERIAQEVLDKERQEAEKQTEVIARQKALETERLERIAQAKITAEKLKLENEKAANAEIARIEAERIAQEKTLAEQKLAENAAIEKAEQERLAAERSNLIEKEKQRQVEAERIAQREALEKKRLEREEQARITAEKLQLEKEELERQEIERLAQAEKERQEAEKEVELIAEQEALEKERQAEIAYQKESGRCSKDISGLIQNSFDNQPIINATIDMYYDGQNIESITSDEKGEFHFYNVDCDTRYTLICFKKDFNNIAKAEINSTSLPDQIVLLLEPDPEIVEAIVPKVIETPKEVEVAIKTEKSPITNKDKEIVYTKEPEIEDDTRQLETDKLLLEEKIVAKKEREMVYTKEPEIEDDTHELETDIRIREKVVDPEDDYNLETEKSEIIAPIIVDKKIQLNPIYFDLDEWYLTLPARRELDRIILLMRQNQTLIIESGSHTDARGNFDYNLELSEKRSQEAVGYLVANGADPDRISGRGYGETIPVNHCVDGVKCSDREHLQNRRTEFVVLKY